MIKTVIVNDFKITIRLFDSQANLNNFLEQLIKDGYKSSTLDQEALNEGSYESSQDEIAKDKTYHLCFNDLGVMYYDHI